MFTGQYDWEPVSHLLDGVKHTIWMSFYCARTSFLMIALHVS